MFAGFTRETAFRAAEPHMDMELPAEISAASERLARAEADHATQKSAESLRELREASEAQKAASKTFGEAARLSADHVRKVHKDLEPEWRSAEAAEAAVLASIRDLQGKLELLEELKRQEEGWRRTLAEQEADEQTFAASKKAREERREELIRDEKNHRRRLKVCADNYRAADASLKRVQAEEQERVQAEEQAAAGEARRKRVREAPAAWVGADTACVLCMDASKTHIFVPCGHLSVCEDCAAGQTRCPVCRAESTCVIKAFVS